ncbi:hypothetical protein GE09DRAFT_1058501 [Coniochaeta sp. 2T2.1]|nr:hypothetical protein GE09DRAFT_1058501 [Coniochaeta sp. 2T2.1]
MTSNNEYYSQVFDHPSADSTQTESGTRMATDSYFPSSHRSSFSSNSSFTIAEPATSGALRPLRLEAAPAPVLRPVQPARAATIAVPQASVITEHKPAGGVVVVVDALSRTFPKPTEEPTLEEMLARPPQKWSVGHYVKNARDAKAAVRDKDAQAKAFAEAKRELLAAKEAMEMRGAR